MTITAQQRKDAFMEDFKALLEKHEAEVDYDTNYTGYDVDIRFIVTMYSEFDEESGDVTKEFVEFDLGE